MPCGIHVAYYMTMIKKTTYVRLHQKKNVSWEERDDIHDVLGKYKFIFDGTLGECKNKPIYITKYKFQIIPW